MTDFKKIFIDTSPVIYYLESNVLYYPKMKEFWNFKLLNAFYAFIDGMDIEFKNIDKAVAEKVAQIRAEYKFFKTMDALQLATACLSGCDLFLTNDKQLKQLREIKCITIEEIEH